MTANYLSVTLLTGYIARKFNADPYLKKVYVQGELSNFKRQASGHLYFTLKDDKSQIRTVMFAKSAQTLGFQPEDGMKVLICGRIDVYERGGNYQFYAQEMQPDGVGALFVRFEQLKKTLTEQGVFADAHKQRLPLFPQRVGVITSPTGAAVRDIITTLKRRSPQTDIILFPAAVQGDQAITEVARQIKRADQFEPPLDVLIVGRGGGSIEDLWAFNEEQIVRAIYDAKVPIISAVGHETDTTLSDYVADYRAATPTAAAEIAVKQTVELLAVIQHQQQLLTECLKNVIANKQQRLSHYHERLARQQPQRVIEQQYQQLDNYQQRLSAALKTRVTAQRFRFERLSWKLQQTNPLDRIERGQEQLQQQTARLDKAYRLQLEHKRLKLSHKIEQIESLSPMQVMQRGFSLVETKTGTVLNKVADVALNEPVRIRMRDGILTATVTKKEMSADGSSKNSKL